MESDMWRQHLRSTVQHLVAFEKQPKEIEGRIITDWFKLAETIFGELYSLGECVKWDYSIVKKGTEVSEFIAHFTRNQKHFQTFVNIYPTLRIDLDVIGSARDICTVRSGIQVLLQGFANIDNRFDKVLKDLEELGEVDELDRCMKIWRDSGYRPDFSSGDKNPSIPESHWWWH